MQIIEILIIILSLSLIYLIFILINKQKEKIKRKNHENWISRGYKYYEWRSEYFITWTEENTYRYDFGKKIRKRYENEGSGYFKNEEELKRWLLSKYETLTFYREL